jgi:serine phosphatase RsbU (regulator of sigma subunit)
MWPQQEVKTTLDKSERTNTLLKEDIETNKMQADDFSASFSRHLSSVQLQLEQLEADLTHAANAQKSLMSVAVAMKQKQQVWFM